MFLWQGLDRRLSVDLISGEVFWNFVSRTLAYFWQKFFEITFSVGFLVNWFKNNWYPMQNRWNSVPEIFGEDLEDTYLVVYLAPWISHNKFLRKTLWFFQRKVWSYPTKGTTAYDLKTHAGFIFLSSWTSTFLKNFQNKPLWVFF